MRFRISDLRLPTSDFFTHLATIQTGTPTATTVPGLGLMRCWGFLEFSPDFFTLVAQFRGCNGSGVRGHGPSPPAMVQ